MKIKQKDKIKVLAGKDKGRTGIVERIYRKSQTVLIPGINIYKKHVKKNDKMPKGGIVEVPRPLAVAKVQLICPQCNKITKVGYKTENHQKKRLCKKCGSLI